MAFEHTKLADRMALAMVALVLLSVSVVGVLAYRNLEQVIVPAELGRLQAEAETRVAGLDNFVNAAVADCLAVRGSATFQSFVEAFVSESPDALVTPYQDRYGRLAGNLRAILRSSPEFLQFRFIGADEDANEIVRVERVRTQNEQGRPLDRVRTVRPTELRPMGAEPFVHRTLLLTDSDVYVSPIQLRREDGELGTPHTPIVRVATPVVAAEGNEPLGILVIDVDMQRILTTIRAGSEPETDVYLVNEQGQYLLHPDPALDFGFERGRTETIADDMPMVADMVGAEQPVSRVVTSPSGERFGAAVAPAVLGRGIRLSVFQVLPYSTMLEGAAAIQRTSLIVATLVSIAAILLAAWYARTLSRPLEEMTRGVQALGTGRRVTLPAGGGPEISALRDAFTEFAERERWYSAALESSEDAIVTATLDGTITGWNRGAEHLYGYARGEVVGANMSIIVPDACRHEHDVQMRRLGSGEGVQQFETTHRSKAGEQIPISMTLSTVRSLPGDVIGASMIARSLMERKEAEQEIAMYTEELKRSNEELEQFAYVASHDLREPLRVIGSFAELLEQHLGDGLDERGRRYVGHMRDGVARMRQLIDDLLSYARIGTREQHLAPVDLGGVLGHVADSMRVALQESGGTLHWNELPEVYGDESQLYQLLQNLVGNAVKFRAERPPLVTVTAAPEGDAWRISVNDHGIGIEPQHAERIFQVFQRLHERGRYEGSGIGLSIAKKIVERHGGRIWFESTPGSGTTFHFTLPAMPA